MQQFPEPYLNSFLINKGIREAYLFQTIDHGEYTPSAPKSAKILGMIKKEFPKLVHTPMQQGVLIAKRPIKVEEYSTDSGLAKLLGFPCVLSAENAYSYSIWATVGTSEVELIAYACDKRYSDSLVNKIKSALAELGIADVYLIERRIVQSSEIVNKLHKGTPLDHEETFKLMNCLYNLGFDSEKFQAVYEQGNAVHNGIMIGLLRLYENNPLAAFYPLQQFPAQMAASDATNDKLEKSVLQSLEQTKTRKGAYRKRTRRTTSIVKPEVR
jgi:hypothetical protein